MKLPFDEKDLQYYFEAQERDTLDLQGRSRRATAMLMIRDRLLSLPEKEFEIAFHSIIGLLNPQFSANSKDDKNKRLDAAELYDITRNVSNNPIKLGKL